MVGLMKFSLYRLLGFSDSNSDGTCPVPGQSKDSQNVVGDEDEDEKARRKTLRRKAKKKRQRQRRKLERVENKECTEQDKENAVADSDLEEWEDSEPEELEGHESLKVERKPETLQEKSPASPPLASGENSNPQPASRALTEEDPGWDVNSAFVANAVSHIRPKAKSKSSQKSKDNKENESKTEVIGLSESTTKRIAGLAEKGIQLAQDGNYYQAAGLFTEAIKCDPNDYRFFGNRSYCYCCLEKYFWALRDAEKSIEMAPDWPKGHFRKGSALMGLKRYSEAENAMEQVLKLDPDCEEAAKDLLDCKLQQLMDMGYDVEQSYALLNKYGSVQAIISARALGEDSELLEPGPCRSLWVGNVTTELTEERLREVFKCYGEIESIRVLHERFCAFVNFKNTNMASHAMEQLNYYPVENTRLLIRYPDRRIQRPAFLPTLQQIPEAAGTPRPRAGTIGEECYYWRTSGCHFGGRCRFRHIPDHQGKEWQP